MLILKEHNAAGDGLLTPIKVNSISKLVPTLPTRQDMNDSAYRRMDISAHRTTTNSGYNTTDYSVYKTIHKSSPRDFEGNQINKVHESRQQTRQNTRDVIQRTS